MGYRLSLRRSRVGKTGEMHSLLRQSKRLLQMSRRALTDCVLGFTMQVFVWRLRSIDTLPRTRQDARTSGDQRTGNWSFAGERAPDETERLSIRSVW